MGEPLRIAFHFHPNDSQGVWFVEKDENGQKRRYLEGISSGLNVDGAGERMSEKAVKGFHDQASSGSITLYSGKHGVDFTDDVGKLVHSEILPNGDWLTRYRLFDAMDGFDPAGNKLEKCDVIWRKVNGLPPYTKAKKLGFSVEGVIPEVGGLASLEPGGKRIMDAVELDGVVLVPRPAYKDSVARAVFKALNVMLPSDMKGGLRASLKEAVDGKIERDEYYRQYYAIQSALDEKVHQIMMLESPERADQLRTLFAEYGDLMVELIMRSESVFHDDTPAGSPVTKDRAFTARRVLVNRLKASASLLEKALATRGLYKGEEADRAGVPA